jgi:hypothetical protein
MSSEPNTSEYYADVPIVGREYYHKPTGFKCVCIDLARGRATMKFETHEQFATLFNFGQFYTMIPRDGDMVFAEQSRQDKLKELRNRRGTYDDIIHLRAYVTQVIDDVADGDWVSQKDKVYRGLTVYRHGRRICRYYVAWSRLLVFVKFGVLTVQSRALVDYHDTKTRDALNARLVCTKGGDKQRIKAVLVDSLYYNEKQTILEERYREGIII